VIAAKLSIVSMISTIDITTIVLIAPARAKCRIVENHITSSQTVLFEQALYWTRIVDQRPLAAAQNPSAISCNTDILEIRIRFSSSSSISSCFLSRVRVRLTVSVVRPR
jgi:hypothetical protein